MAHTTVLQQEAVTGLALNEGAVVVDCTFGSGGHATEILKQLGSTGVYIGIDADSSAVAGKKLSGPATTHLVHGNFKDLVSIIAKLGIKAPNAILADLGWRSEQFEAGKKGFSFLKDEPLCMTYGDPKMYTFTAEDIVNDWDETSIADIIYGYGEERSSRKIARAIVDARHEGPIKTSGQLASVIEGVVKKHGRIHPATKTFQALRIAVNDELGALKSLLADGIELLAPGGRMAIITFHSLEDRIVKQFFREQSRDHVGERVTKKPITASKEELAANPRARSAKLRIFQKK